MSQGDALTGVAVDDESQQIGSPEACMSSYVRQ